MGNINKSKLCYLLVIFAFIISSTSASYAKSSHNNHASDSSSIIMSSNTFAPLGFQIFCLRNPKECRSSSQKITVYSSSLMRIALQINSSVNRSIRPQEDSGVDVWTINSKVGDCEDYVITKRSKLIKAGVSSGALRIATATTRAGVGHAVLVIKTNQGDFVLDNRTNSIKLWNKTDLIMIAMSGSNPKRWKKIN